MISCKWRPNPLACKPPGEWPTLVAANRLLKQRVPPTQRVAFQRIPCWVGAAQLSSPPAWKSHRVTEKHLLSSCLSASLAVKWYMSCLMLINFLIWECTLHFVLPVYSFVFIHTHLLNLFRWATWPHVLVLSSKLPFASYRDLHITLRPFRISSNV